MKKEYYQKLVTNELKSFNDKFKDDYELYKLIVFNDMYMIELFKIERKYCK